MGKPKRSTFGAMKSKSASLPRAQVVDLDEVRRAHQREINERRVRRVLEENRTALKRLFASGLIFTQKGSRVGRDLLGAQLALLKLIDLLSRTLEECDIQSGPASLVLSQLNLQLVRTAQVTARTGEFIAGRSSE